MRDKNNAPITTPVRMYYAGNYLGNPYYTLDGASVVSPGYGLNGGVVSIQEEWQLTLVPSSNAAGDPKYLAGGGDGTIASLAGEYSPYGYSVQSGNAIVATRTSSASQIIAAVAANPAAAALVSGTLALGNDGTGTITAMAKTNIVLLATTYAAPMAFFDTSTNNTGNVLTGDASFACTAQNLGFVTGTSTFTQCAAPSIPVTTSESTDTTPDITGTCLPKTLVTLYNGATALTPSTLCTDAGTYTITPTLAPGAYTLTARQSNRKGPEFGMSVDSPPLPLTIGCSAGLVWNGIACSSPCTQTEAPNELQANVDRPYIDCAGREPSTGRYFKYRISNP